MSELGYVCPDCGKTHEGLPTDWGFKLPDEIFRLSYLDTYRRTRSNSDLCTLDERRHFIRGVLNIPFSDESEGFAWGVWVEVNKEIHDFYLDNFKNDFAEGSEFQGHLANAIPGFEELLGQPLRIAFRDSKNRPFFHFPDGFDHPLANDQRVGIDSARHHEFLESCGHFDEENG